MFQRLVKQFQDLSSARQNAVACLLLALAVFITYCNVYHYDFLLDDQSLIITNVFLRDWHHWPKMFTHLNYFGSGAEKGFYRPIELTLRMIIFQMFGLSKPAFHGINIILHALNAACVYLLGRKLGFYPMAIFAATLLWAVHPIFTQEVAYISSTSELLWTTFALLALLVLLPDFSPRKICFALVLVLLGLGSKETMVVFPALATACLFLISAENNRLKLSTYLPTVPFWLLSAAFAITYRLVNHYNVFNTGSSPALENYAHHIFPRILTSLATLPTYLSVVFYPFDLHMERVFPVFESVLTGPVLLGGAMAAGALAQIILGKGKRGLPLTFGFIWFAAALSPVTGIFAPTDALISEGWLYTPLIGLVLGTAQMLSGWIKNVEFRQAKAVTTGVVAVLAVFLSVKTYLQNQFYENAPIFYGHIFDTGGYKTRAYPDLGDYYLNQREFDKAAENFKLALANPDEHNVPSAAMHAQLALAYLNVVSDEYYMVTPEAVAAGLPVSTHIQEAIDELNLALRLDPNFFFGHTILSAIYHFKGEERVSQYHHQKMLEILHAQGKI